MQCDGKLFQDFVQKPRVGITVGTPLAEVRETLQRQIGIVLERGNSVSHCACSISSVTPRLPSVPVNALHVTLQAIVLPRRLTACSMCSPAPVLPLRHAR